MSSFPLLLIGIGLALIAIGLLWHFGGKYIPLGNLPGDINIQGGKVRFYFPLATSLLLSLVLTLLFWIWSMVKK